MSTAKIEAALLEYVGQEILEGEAEDLETSTPLLEWGLLNSVEIPRLFAFIETTFGVNLPGHLATPANLRDISAIAQMVDRNTK